MDPRLVVVLRHPLLVKGELVPAGSEVAEVRPLGAIGIEQIRRNLTAVGDLRVELRGNDDPAQPAEATEDGT